MQSEDLTVAAGHRDERAAVRGPLAVIEREPDAVVERFLRRALKLGVDRQADVVARPGSWLNRRAP